jgi:hypothetical protein
MNNDVKTMLYNLASQCASKNGEGECKMQCEQCQYNVFNYCNDPREASLIKANAYSDYENYNKNKRERQAVEAGESLVKLIVIAVIVGLIATMCNGC